jgi:hypothetical protein
LKSVLLYNLYPKYRWKEITASLLSIVPHDVIIVHVSMPWTAWPYIFSLKNELKKYPKIGVIFWSYNRKKLGESRGFDKIRRLVDFNLYESVTYIHSKGYSTKKKDTAPIRDWTELMRYYVVERHDLCKEAFAKGMALYGVNLQPVRREGFPAVTFHYSGTFVSCNLTMVREKFLKTLCAKNYFGVEMFWGALTDISHAACAHISNVNHYTTDYPPGKYR